MHAETPTTREAIAHFFLCVIIIVLCAERFLKAHAEKQESESFLQAEQARYCNPLTAACTLFAIVALHLQILQEERFLIGTFGTAYQEYMEQVRRYLGRKSHR